MRQELLSIEKQLPEEGSQVLASDAGELVTCANYCIAQAHQGPVDHEAVGHGWERESAIAQSRC